ncbi:MAG: hypothetical protein KBD24_04600, partial [Candidatus Pacebacteria bacterium]|nr:hypothetical protein [Candidatus Paceibacterota bacterium]
MGNFKGGNKFGGDRGERRFEGGNGGGRKFGGDRGSGNGRSFGGARHESDRAPMHHAICSECRKECEVPFRPTADRPVFCPDCFRGRRDDAPRPTRDGGDTRDRGGRDVRPHVHEHRPYQQSVPVHPGNTNEQYKVQFELLHAKLDRVLGMLERSTDVIVKEEVVTTALAPSTTKTSKVARPVKESKKMVETEELKKVLAKAVAKPEVKKAVVKKVTIPKKVSAKKITK